MRTNIVLDDKLVRKAMRATGLKTKRAVVHAGLELLVSIHDQSGIRDLRGAGVWQDSPEPAREGRPTTGRKSRSGSPSAKRRAASTEE